MPKGEVISRVTRWGISIVLVLAVLLVVIAVPRYQAEEDYRNGFLEKTEIPAQINEYRQTLIQIIGGLVVLIGLYLTWRRILATEETVVVSQEGQITERFTKAIEQLANEDMAIRLGGIYALERIAKDSEKDHWTVMEVLSAYVRENALIRRQSLDASDSELDGDEIIPVSTDIQAILTVIGRRKEGREEGWFDLQATNLQEANLAKANLQGADLFEADLRGADLRKANLEEATLVSADLRKANLEEANLLKAKLLRANLEEAFLQRTNLWHALPWIANLRRAVLFEANLRGAILSESNLQNAYLPKAKLEGANLKKTNLREADLEEADLRYADLQEADLQEANLKKTDLQEANLRGVNLPKANLEGTNLKKADLRGANLQEANLRGANLQKANLEEADLRGANLQEADLRKAKNLRVEQLGKTTILKDSKLDVPLRELLLTSQKEEAETRGNQEE